ncbi:MAG: hypothetical protein ABI670_11015 [Chloroflexota bacterium]
MASDRVSEIIRQAETLSTTEQLELIARLAERAKKSYETAEEPKERRKWSEIMGIAPGLLAGVDAQEWVSLTRRDSEQHRQESLKTNHTDTNP